METEPLQSLWLNVPAACARHGSAAEAAPGYTKLVVDATPGGVASSLARALAHSSLRPTLSHVAPAIVCGVVCPEGHSLAAATRSGVADPWWRKRMPYWLPPQLSSCLKWHADDYATCGLGKERADRRFVDCYSVPPGVDVRALPTWWSAELQRHNTSAAQGVAIRSWRRRSTATPTPQHRHSVANVRQAQIGRAHV